MGRTQPTTNRNRTLLKLALSTLVAALAAYLAFVVLDDHGWLFYLLLFVLAWNAAEVVIYARRYLRQTAHLRRA